MGADKTAAVDKLADDLFAAKEYWNLEDLRALARVAAQIGWDEGHNHCFHVDPPQATGNPYTTEEPS